MHYLHVGVVGPKQLAVQAARCKNHCNSEIELAACQAIELVASVNKARGIALKICLYYTYFLPRRC